MGETELKLHYIFMKKIFYFTLNQNIYRNKIQSLSSIKNKVNRFFIHFHLFLKKTIFSVLTFCFILPLAQ